jgi:uncharacterized membrane protein
LSWQASRPSTSGAPLQFWARAGEDNAPTATSTAKSLISTSSLAHDTSFAIPRRDYLIKSRRLIDSSNQIARNRHSCPRTILQSGIYRCAAWGCATHDRLCQRKAREARRVVLFRGAETHTRSILKAVSWRTLGTLDTFVISWFFTGRAAIAGSIAGIEIVTKIAWYYLHERVWASIPWGRC